MLSCFLTNSGWNFNNATLMVNNINVSQRKRNDMKSKLIPIIKSITVQFKSFSVFIKPFPPYKNISFSGLRLVTNRRGILTLIPLHLRSGSLYMAIALITVISATILSCEKDNNGPDKRGYAKGAFISCEGSFNAGNGSVSWYDPDSSEVVNNLFSLVNGRPAGDVVQSFSVAGDYGVIVANNSHKIEVVDLETFESAATITGFSYPRYFVYSGNGIGYLSNGSSGGQVYKIDLARGEITDTIEVGQGPERMVILGNHLFVANSGGWGFDNTVSVIDIVSDQVVKTIEVGDIPVALVADRNNDIWVLCRGKVVYDETWTEIIEETDSKLVRINTAILEADRHVVTGSKGDWFNPSWLTVNPEKDELWFGEAEGVVRMSIDDPVQPAEPYIAEMFSYAVKDPVSGLIFALEVADYNSPGLLHVYNGDNLHSTIETGIAPGGITFTE